jgi:tetratricopeptide (TPR) repeat protein
VERRLGAAGKEWGFSWLERGLIASRAVWFYLGKLFWPEGLTFIYPRWEIRVSSLSAYVPLLAGAGGLGVLWWKRKGWGEPALLALAYFLTLLFLTLGFFNVFYFRYSFVSDHFQYFACLGPVALAAAGVNRAFRAFQRAGVFLAPAVYAVILSGLALLTREQCGMYANVETLWRTTIQRNPGAYLAYANLGGVLLLKGELNEAMTDCRRALEIEPDYPVANNNLGCIFLRQDRVEDAIASFRKALEVQPDYADARNNLGLALMQAGRAEEARTQFQQLVEAAPDSAVAHYNLGNVLFRTGRVAEAIGHYETALETKPDSAEIHYNLAAALLQSGRTNEASLHCQRALELRPDLVGNARNDPALSTLLRKGTDKP